MSGSIETSGGSGSADFSASILGPDGDVSVWIDANRQGGVWSHDLRLTCPDGTSVDLLP